VKNIVNPLKIEAKKSSLNKVYLGEKSDINIDEYKKTVLSKESKDLLLNMVKRVAEYESK